MAQNPAKSWQATSATSKNPMQMNPLKHILAPLLLLFLSTSAWATQPSLAEKTASIEKAYQNAQTLKAEFVQTTYVDLLDRTVSNPGRLFYKTGGKIRIEYAGETMTHYISNSKTLWVLDPMSKQKQVYALKDSGLPAEALRFLTELGSLNTYFRVETKKEGALRLTPQNKSTYRYLDCIFGEGNYLKSLAIYSRSGNVSTYRFFNTEANTSLSDSLFELKK